MTNNALSEARELMDSGDARALVRHLRRTADEIPLPELAVLMGRLAAEMGFDDLAATSAELIKTPEHPMALYDFGYACVARGVSAIAVPPLREALRLVPGNRRILMELCVALEDEERHAEAVAALEANEPALEDWPDRYLLVFNSLMAGRPSAERFARLSPPADRKWTTAYDRVRRISDRLSLVHPGEQDLRGWHFALSGGILSTISPFGYEEPMAGRYAYLGDNYGLCLFGLRRLRLVLETAGRSPRAVALLPDRSSRILGLAAARFFDLPTREYEPGLRDVLVVAYDLNEVTEDAVASLHERARGQVLFEHATCWTDPPGVSADVSTLLQQRTIAPWEPQLTADGRGEADERPAEVIAADILGAEASADCSVDADADFVAFVRAAAASWLSGPRDRVRSAGPVRSAKFG